MAGGLCQLNFGLQREQSQIRKTYMISDFTTTNETPPLCAAPPDFSELPDRRSGQRRFYCGECITESSMARAKIPELTVSLPNEQADSSNRSQRPAKTTRPRCVPCRGSDAFFPATLQEPAILFALSAAAL